MEEKDIGKNRKDETPEEETKSAESVWKDMDDGEDTPVENTAKDSAAGSGDAGSETKEGEAGDGMSGAGESDTAEAEAGESETEAETGEDEAAESETGESEAAGTETGEGESGETVAPEDKKARDGKERKGFFSKKKDPRDTQIEELTDRLRRTMAEFDNFRKRTEKEKSSMYEIGAKSVIEKILPVVDNFERGLSSIPEEAKGTPFADGMEKIYKQLMKELEGLGVKPIEAVGKEFDPNFHNAVMHVEDESLGENIVAAELQKGYMYRDSVVRHSMVQVAN